MLTKADTEMRLRSRASNLRGESLSNGSAPSDSRPVLGDVSNRTRQNNNVGEKDHLNLKQPTRLTVNEADENNAGVELRRSLRVRNIVSTKSSNRTKRKNSPPKVDERKLKNVKKDVTQSNLQSSSHESYLPSQEEEEEEREESTRQPLDSSHVHPMYCLQRSASLHRKLTSGVAPHDKKGTKDVLEVANYVSDLFQNLFDSESASYPRRYMSNQDDINAKMRAILIDWLIEVHMKFRLVPDTLYLCVNIIDRYCNCVGVRRNKLQLVGVTALLIACKYEEIYPPEVRDCVYITDRAYRKEEVLAMEHDILGRLNYRISAPTAYPFLLRFINIVRASPLTKHAANYYMERTLQEHDLLEFRPSLMATAAVMLALSNKDILARENLVRENIAIRMKYLLDFTGFKIKEIFECAGIMEVKIGEEPVTASNRQLTTVKKKYNSSRFQSVSRTVSLPSASNIIPMIEQRE